MIRANIRFNIVYTNIKEKKQLLVPVKSVITFLTYDFQSLYYYVERLLYKLC